METNQSAAAGFEPAVPPQGPVLSINQIVSYNLMRARRSHGWTQQDVALLLEQYTGRPWSNASVSAAERAWRKGGRTRRFDASEIVALSKIFDEPIAYFFIPPDEDELHNKFVGMREFPDGAPEVDPQKDHDLMALIPAFQLLEMAAIHDAPADFTSRIRRHVKRYMGMTWDPPVWGVRLRQIEDTEELVRTVEAGEANAGDSDWKTQPEEDAVEAAAYNHAWVQLQEAREEAQERIEAELRPEDGDISTVLRRAADILESLGEKPES